MSGELCLCSCALHSTIPKKNNGSQSTAGDESHITVNLYPAVLFFCCCVLFFCCLESILFSFCLSAILFVDFVCDVFRTNKIDDLVWAAGSDARAEYTSSSPYEHLVPVSFRFFLLQRYIWQCFIFYFIFPSCSCHLCNPAVLLGASHPLAAQSPTPPPLHRKSR